MMTDYDHKKDWFYEGQVSHQLVTALKKEGFTILKDNSENIMAHGPDIIAKKEMVLLVVEVKGYPTTFHTKGVNKGLPKKTDPKLQAKHWFSEVIFCAVRNYRTFKSEKNAINAVAFPFVKRYKELIVMVEDFFVDNDLNLPVFFVDETGNVTEENLNPKQNRYIF